MSRITFCLITAACAGSLSADVAVNFVPVDNSVAPELTGYVTQDIRVLTTHDWSSSGMLLNLTSGSIYQDASAGAGDTPPNPLLFASAPSLEFDTYVGILDDAIPSIAGTAGDLGGTSAGWPYQFDTAGLDATWFNMPGYSVGDDTGISSVGRLSLTDDAQGTLAFSVSEADKELVTYEFPIVNGQVIPVSCPDLGGDSGCGIIGIDELNNVLTHWNQSVAPGSTLMGDFEPDGFVGIDDLNSVLSFWNLDTFRETQDLDYVIYDPWGDGFVGISDLNLVLLDWNRTAPPANPFADHNEDGYIGQDDLNAIQSNWNVGTPPPPALIPEPVSIALLFCGTPLLLCRNRG
jgi:hypothetical protein